MLPDSTPNSAAVFSSGLSHPAHCSQRASLSTWLKRGTGHLLSGEDEPLLGGRDALLLFDALLDPSDLNPSAIMSSGTLAVSMVWETRLVLGFDVELNLRHMMDVSSTRS